jgi:thiol-disulfide isomerase/thioredoxin
MTRSPFYLIAGAALLIGCSNADAPAISEAPSSVAQEVVSSVADMPVKTKAVLIYADWCGSCKVLDPAVKKVQGMGPIPGAEFVTLDYTDKDDEAFFAAAEAAGVGPAIRSALDGKVKTGQLFLVDLDDQAVIQKITKDDAAPTILSKIQDAVAQS